MDNLDFFPGDRIYTFIRKHSGGKVQFTWLVLENWDERMGRSLNCGVERTYTLKKCLGISSVEREDFESTITGSIGMKGIAEIESEVKSKIGRELRLEESIEEEEEFHFQAPKCGRLTLRVYQFKRVHQFSYIDKRFWLWRKESFTKTITEWTNYLYDKSIIITTDPACNCENELDNEIEGLVNLSFGKLGTLVGYKHSEKGVEFPSLKISFPGKTIEQVLFNRFAFDRQRIPSHLLFLAGEEASRLTGQFLPYGEAWLRGTRQEISEDYESSREARVGMNETREAVTSMNLLSLLVGGSIGAILALLFAPKAGRELRADITDVTSRGIGAANRIYDNTSSRVADTYNAVFDKTRATEAAVSELARRQSHPIAVAIEAGKQAYREKGTRTHEERQLSAEGE